MIILRYLGTDCNTYRETYLPALRDGGPRIPRRCPACGHEGMHVHAYPERQVITRERVEWITVMRVRCPACRSTHTVLPHFCIPHHSYSARCVLAALMVFLRCGTYAGAKRRLQTLQNPIVVRQWHHRFRTILPALCAVLEQRLLLQAPQAASRLTHGPRQAFPLQAAVCRLVRAADAFAVVLRQRLAAPILPQERAGLLAWAQLLLWPHRFR